MPEQDFDPEPLLTVLLDHEVLFVVIGGLAARAHGSPSITGDLDVCYARTEANLERLAAALRALDAVLRGAPQDVPFQLDARSLANGDSFTFTTSWGSLDVLGTPAGSDGYEDLHAGAARKTLGGYQLLVASLDDLIRMKQAAGRARDRAEVEILEALREERER